MKGRSRSLQDSSRNPTTSVFFRSISSAGLVRSLLFSMMLLIFMYRPTTEYAGIDRTCCSDHPDVAEYAKRTIFSLAACIIAQYRHVGSWRCLTYIPIPLITGAGLMSGVISAREKTGGTLCLVLPGPHRLSALHGSIDAYGVIYAYSSIANQSYSNITY